MTYDVAKLRQCFALGTPTDQIDYFLSIQGALFIKCNAPVERLLSKAALILIAGRNYHSDALLQMLILSKINLNF